MRFKLPHTVVYWGPGGVDGYGQPTLAAPVQYKARFELSVNQTLDPQGEQVLSSATVYLLEEVEPGGFIMKGTLTDTQASSFPANPRGNRRVREIITVESDENLKGTVKLYVAQLK